MGHLADQIRKDMSEEDIISQTDLADKTNNVVDQTTISKLLRGVSNVTTRTINELARALNRDPLKYRVLAFLDRLPVMCNEMDIQHADAVRALCKSYQPQDNTPVLPLYRAKDVENSLSKAGYPTAKGVPFKTLRDYGKYAYALLIEDNSIYPRALQGDVVILSPTKKGPNPDYGVIASKKELHMGRVTVTAGVALIETKRGVDYETHHFRTSQVVYYHRIVGHDRPEKPITF